eukprot:6684966-Lingulodinium_polyedra.AAC.1
MQEKEKENKQTEKEKEEKANEKENGNKRVCPICPYGKARFCRWVAYGLRRSRRKDEHSVPSWPQTN